MGYAGWPAVARYNFMLANYQETPTKPTFYGEGYYEREPGGKGSEVHSPLIVRQQAYWAMLSGGCGHTYCQVRWIGYIFLDAAVLAG
jgi:hypothetical protein